MSFERFTPRRRGRMPEPPMLTFDADRDRLYLTLTARRLVDCDRFRVEFDREADRVRLVPDPDGVYVAKSGWMSVRGFQEATGWGSRRWGILLAAGALVTPAATVARPEGDDR